MILSGFPLDVGGTEKYRTDRGYTTQDAELEEQAAVAKLTQSCEQALRDKLKHGKGSPEELAEMVKEVALSPAVQPFLERVHAVQLVADILEVDFSAVGFPDRYASYVGVDGTGGRYKVRKLARPSPVVSSRCSWVEAEDGKRCIAEALNQQGETVARVTMSIEQQQQHTLAPYRGEDGIHAIEDSAMRIVRMVALDKG